MSLSVSVDGKPIGDVATNSDWEDLIEVAEGEVKTLVNDGYSTDLDKLFSDLEKAVKNNKKKSLTKTLESLKQAASKGGEILIVS